MKHNIKSMVSGIIIGTMLTSGIAIAKNRTELLEAWYSDIKIYMNTTKIHPKDANGNTVEPFIVDGTTYLPIRAVAEAFNKNVTWDGDTNSIYLTDNTQPTPTESPAPTEAPTPAPVPTQMPAPSEFSYTTNQILQISGYREDAIKGEITTSWDASQPKAVFTAKMRCNNGGLADYIDCEIILAEVISTETNGFSGYFDVSMNGDIRHEHIKGTLTVDGAKLSLHTQEYDYRLIAKLQNVENSSPSEIVTFYSLQAIKFNGKKATGLFGIEFGDTPTDTTLTGSFKMGEQNYTLQVEEIVSISEDNLQGIFTLLCDGEVVASKANGTIKNLSAPLGDVMTLSIQDVPDLQLRVVEIGY